MKMGNFVHEIMIMFLPDSNTEPTKHNSNALSSDTAGKHIYDHHIIFDLKIQKN